MADDPDEARLKALEERLAKLKSQGKTRAKPRMAGAGFSQGEVAWRMVIELVTGMVLGLAIGYGLDVLCGTRPIFLVMFSLLGFAGGVRTMMGTAKQLTKDNAAPAVKDERD